MSDLRWSGSLPWVREPSRERAVLLSRASWAFAELARSIGQKKGHVPHFWFPDFFCNESLGKIRASGARISFYPVGADFLPDFEAWQRRMREASADVIVLVHYFGDPAPAAKVARLCREKGALLLEDAAHVLMPIAGVGQEGDLVLYSPRKQFGLRHGAVLVARRDGLIDDWKLPSAKGSSWSELAWGLKRALRRGLPPLLRARLRPLPTEDFERDPESGEVDLEAELPGLAASGRSRLLKRAARLEEEFQRRRGQGRRWVERLAVLEPALEPLRWLSNPGVAPHGAVFRASSPTEAARIYARFRRAGVAVQSWPDLPPEVRAAPQEHLEAIQLRNTLLVFPLEGSW